MRLCGEQATHQALSYHFYHENSYTPLARFDCGALPGEELYFVHAEANGMPSLLSDAGGRIVWQPLKSGLFGRVMREKSTLSPYAAGQNLRFAGQYHDEETGLHYNTLRYYDPESGRFTQPDPVGLAGGINLYAYVPNPLSWIDPLGLTCGKIDGNIDPKDVRYMQSSIKNQTGEHTVLGNADALLNGTLKPSDLPPIKIWQDDLGKIWTLDHRRLAAFKLAGLDSVPFKWASPSEVANQMWKMTTKTDGKSITLKLGGGINKILE